MTMYIACGCASPDCAENGCKALRQMRAKQDACPTCGTCPTCGHRANPPPPYPSTWAPQQPWWNGTSGSAAQPRGDKTFVIGY